MASKEVIIETIKKMLANGIEEETIVNTLKDVGLGKGEAVDLISEAQGKPVRVVEEIEEKAFTPSKEEIAQETSRQIKEHLDEKSIEDDLKHNSLHLKLDEHKANLEDTGRKLSTIKQRVEGLHEKIQSNDLSELTSRISAIEKELKKIEKISEENKSTNEAIEKLLKNLMQSQRKILTKL